MNQVHTTLGELDTVLCAGPGGSGKTTVSAALAIAAAQVGRKVALITIDPAKRLADSMGLKFQENALVELTKRLPENSKGSLHATMLNPQQTFLTFASELGGKQLVEQLKKNRLIPLITSQYSGTHEVFAFEKLQSLRSKGDFDLLVVDTPPSQHFNDFFEAPEVIGRLLEEENFAYFDPSAHNTSWKERIRSKGIALSLQALQKVTGDGVLKDFATLVPLLFQMREPFLERQRKIQSHLRSKSGGVFFVFGSDTLNPKELPSLLSQLQKQNLHYRGTFLNRSLLRTFNHKKPKLSPEEQNHPMAKHFSILWKQETDTLNTVKENSGFVISLPETERNSDEFAGLVELATYF